MHIFLNLKKQCDTISLDIYVRKSTEQTPKK